MFEYNSDKGCGRNSSNISTQKECPECGRKLRVIGNIRNLELHLQCPECGYYSPELTTEEINTLI